MSYAMVGGFGDAGVPGGVDVSAYIPGGQSPLSNAPLPTQADTLQQIASSTPSASDVEGDWGPAIDQAGKAYQQFSHLNGDKGKAVQYGLQTIPGILQDAGIDGPVADIAAVAAGLAPQFGALVDGHPGPLVMAGIKSGAAYGCKALGIPPQYGTATLDTIGDVLNYGQINNQDLANMGGFGGAVGGSALCSLIGVPPCIGGYVGGVAGKALGGVIASVLGIGGGKKEREAKKRAWQAQAAAFSAELDSMRSGYAALLMAMRGTWWAGFDALVDMMSTQWTAMECSFAYARFPLLWSGQGAVNPFFLYPYSASICTIPINRNLSRGTGCLNSKALLANVTRAGCAEPYGCPYPSFPSLGAADQYNERVVQALAAYDIWWVPPGSARSAIDQMWVDALAKGSDVPTDPTLARHQRGESWVSWLTDQATAQKGCKSNSCRNTFQTEISQTTDYYKVSLENTTSDALSFDGVEAAFTRISGDLCATAGIYAAAAAINANRSQLIAGNYQSALATQKSDADLIVQMNDAYMKAVTFGHRMNLAVNYSMLLLGGGLLGAALYKGMRRR